MPPRITQPLAKRAPEEAQPRSSAMRQKRRIGGLAESGLTASKQDVLVFTQHFSSLYRAGIGIVKCLEALEEQAEKAVWRTLLKQIGTNVTQGTSLADSLSRFPRIFPPMYVTLVRAGEQVGALADVLDRLAQMYEREIELQGRLRTAFIYPAIVLTAAVAVVVWLMIKVVPLFVKIYGKNQSLLPWPTQFIIFLSNVSVKGGPYLLILLVGLLLLLRWYVNTKNGRMFVDRLGLRIPVLGTFIYKAAILRFSRVLGASVAGGVPVVPALEIVEDVLGNAVLKKAMREVREGVKKGDTISGQMKKKRVFTPIVIRMVAVAEETGNLEEMLGRVADFYERDLETAIRRFLAALEPTLTVVIGSLVAFVAFSLYMPLFNLSKVVGQ